MQRRSEVYKGDFKKKEINQSKCRQKQKKLSQLQNERTFNIDKINKKIKNILNALDKYEDSEREPLQQNKNNEQRYSIKHTTSKQRFRAKTEYEHERDYQQNCHQNNKKSQKYNNQQDYEQNPPQNNRYQDFQYKKYNNLQDKKYENQYQQNYRQYNYQKHNENKFNYYKEQQKKKLFQVNEDFNLENKVEKIRKKYQCQRENSYKKNIILQKEKNNQRDYLNRYEEINTYEQELKKKVISYQKQIRNQKQCYLGKRLKTQVEQKQNKHERQFEIIRDQNRSKLIKGLKNKSNIFQEQKNIYKQPLIKEKYQNQLNIKRNQKITKSQLLQHNNNNSEFIQNQKYSFKRSHNQEQFLERNSQKIFPIKKQIKQLDKSMNYEHNINKFLFQKRNQLISQKSTLQLKNNNYDKNIFQGESYSNIQNISQQHPYKKISPPLYQKINSYLKLNERQSKPQILYNKNQSQSKYPQLIRLQKRITFSNEQLFQSDGNLQSPLQRQRAVIETQCRRSNGKAVYNGHQKDVLGSSQQCIKLMSCLQHQIQLDRQFRHNKKWFEFCTSAYKWVELNNTLRTHNVRLAETSAENIFSCKPEEDDPFYTFRCQASSIPCLVQSFIKCQENWFTTVAGHFQHTAIQSLFKHIDLQGLGYIQIQHLTRFINSRIDASYRNRDLFLIYTRCRIQNTLTLKQFIHVLCE